MGDCIPLGIEMSDDETPTNVFKFPSIGRSEDSSQASPPPPFQPGAFIDANAATIFDEIAKLDDRTLKSLAYEFRKHIALATMLVDVIEAEQLRRD